MKTLYPPLEPYVTYNLQVDEVHTLYVEECGNRFGMPVVVLHGGPASGCKPDHRRFFDPQRYRVILFDQRGSGRSTPKGELSQNTTLHLIEDMEYIRRRLGVESWLLFGGSWGAALALLYAQRFADKVCGLILRGSFLARSADLRWFLHEGLNRIYPEQWHRLMASVQGGDAKTTLTNIQKLLHGDDELAQRRIAREWDIWSSTASLGTEVDSSGLSAPVQDLIGRVKIEMHYATNVYFIEDNQICKEVSRLPDVPIKLLHGRYDLVCPVEAAYSLHKYLPDADLEILAHSGHLAKGEEMVDALIRASDAMLEKAIR